MAQLARNTAHHRSLWRYCTRYPLVPNSHPSHLSNIQSTIKLPPSLYTSQSTTARVIPVEPGGTIPQMIRTLCRAKFSPKSRSPLEAPQSTQWGASIWLKGTFEISLFMGLCFIFSVLGIGPFRHDTQN